jgi:hypothetical protein
MNFLGSASCEKPSFSYRSCASRVASIQRRSPCRRGSSNAHSTIHVARPAPRCGLVTNTSARYANVAKSVITRAKPTCSRPGASELLGTASWNNPKHREPRHARSSTSREIPVAQYEVERKAWTKTRSRSSNRVVMRYGGRRCSDSDTDSDIDGMDDSPLWWPGFGILAAGTSRATRQSGAIPCSSGTIRAQPEPGAVSCLPYRNTWTHNNRTRFS